MKYELSELNKNMVDILYPMYQDIPDGENGQTNKAYRMNKEEFAYFIEKEISRKQNRVTYDDTPTTTYVLFVNENPVGYICLRTEIDGNWKLWSGNFYYQIRKSERKKGYGTKMLTMALNEFRKMGFKEVFCNSSTGNIGSEKVIENNGGIFENEINGSKYYRIEL